MLLLVQTRPLQQMNANAKAKKCNVLYRQRESWSQSKYFIKSNLNVGNISNKKMKFSTKIHFPPVHSVCFLLYKIE